MPELPDITVYIEALETRVLGRRLVRIAISSPFLLRSIEPRPDACVGRRAVAIRRIGKRIAIGFEDDHWLVLHLMIAGRLHWFAPLQARRSKRPLLAAFEFESGTLTLTEAGSKRRASLHVVHGAEALAALDRGGIEIATLDPAAFAARLQSENHTLKRALTDPRLFSGIGNAYSDEILHRARLSPLALTGSLSPDELQRLYVATNAVLDEWTERLRREAGQVFPERVTAFREGMAVHGRYDQPCPVCGTRVQRIRYAENETNYCPRCQTAGRVLSDRSLARLLKDDWPRTIEELELKRAPRPG
jgi:formamidopyrimidine-DNA glycosylase